ncbi:17.3 kDa class II heat shock protein-like [Quillaja saponaria]|uniref:17.3 kDa class II heat shock protein-like n=1 Tax=Quillaja saponaria TaxID=32244 RepID=A0AAD7PT05_QUISA|nr:17.3 kDa class II heat shock protein-like [Quillaja saponaria]
MDLRIMGLDSPLFSTLKHVMDIGDEGTDRSINAPSRTYVRDAKAIAATPADVKDGERKREEEKDGVKYVRMERRVGKFMRKFVLPENANTDAISAVCQDGVLTVTVQKLPPPEPKKPKTIEVKIV